MKKSSILLAAALVFGAVFSCTKPEALDLQPAYQYTDAYYEALRAYKKSDHSISYLWFADYGVPSSPAYRFAGIPDSVDVVSLWGGIPKEGTLDRKEMYEMRDKKGTKIVAVRITRLAPSNANYYSYSWADDAKIPYMSMLIMQHMKNRLQQVLMRQLPLQLLRMQESRRYVQISSQILQELWFQEQKVKQMRYMSILNGADMLQMIC